MRSTPEGQGSPSPEAGLRKRGGGGRRAPVPHEGVVSRAVDRIPWYEGDATAARGGAPREDGHWGGAGGAIGPRQALGMEQELEESYPGQETPQPRKSTETAAAC